MSNVMSADVVVIGGGIIGSSTAYEMARAGLDVVLCEMRNLGSGASGRCGGMMCHCYGRENNLDHAEERLKFSRYNSMMLEKRQQELDIDYEVRRHGLLDVWTSEEEAEEGRRLYEQEIAQIGDSVKLLDRQEAISEMPTLNPNLVFGARYRAEDGNLAPYKLCAAMGFGAQKLGARIMTHTKVEKILIENDRIVGVQTDKGTIYCKWVLNATNGWSRTLCKEAEAVLPVREAACVTEAIGKVPGQPFEMLLKGQFAYGGTQTASGNLTIGGPAHPRDKRVGYYNETMYIDEVRRMASYLKEVFPRLEDLKIIRAWIGTMGFAKDAMPLIGQSSLTEGLLIAAGFVAGVNKGCTVGRIMTDIVTTGEVSLDLDMSLYDPGRFLKRPPIENWPEVYDISINHDYIAALRHGTAENFKLPYDLTVR